MREADGGYNCFAWAVGIDTYQILNSEVEKAGFSPNLDGWTGYLKVKHRFGKYVDGPDESADLVLFGANENMIYHAARKADQPFGRMTFSSKLGGGYTKTHVILHALLDLEEGDIEGSAYGKALRSFWRTSEPTPESSTNSE